MIARDVQRKWKRRHRIRHAVSTRAFCWLSERKFLKNTPADGFCIKEHTLRLSTLPPQLAGLRIAHISDLHVGQILRPEHLPPIVAAVNELHADIIVNTGDLIDHSNNELAAVVQAMMQLWAPLGVYTVLGNHDHRDNPLEIVHAFRMADLTLLINDYVRIEHNQHRIAIAGIDWAESDQRISQLVDQTCARIHDVAVEDPLGRNPPGRDELTILLAHHPHALDHAANHNVNLVLSGHTHGGQFIFRNTRPHERESFGLGNLRWRYPQGHYQRGDTHLFVTNGLGGSFPIRFRCPAEVSVLELQSA